MQVAAAEQPNQQVPLPTPPDTATRTRDDIHGQILLNWIERDVIDSPEFQRPFRLSQLGFVDLVYPMRFLGCGNGICVK